MCLPYGLLVACSLVNTLLGHILISNMDHKLDLDSSKDGTTPHTLWLTNGNRLKRVSVIWRTAIRFSEMSVRFTAPALLIS